MEVDLHWSLEGGLHWSSVMELHWMPETWPRSSPGEVDPHFERAEGADDLPPFLASDSGKSFDR